MRDILIVTVIMLVASTVFLVQAEKELTRKAIEMQESRPYLVLEID